ncbi:BCCT family transporter [Alkalihalobacillus trypoxylicola]|uniref:Glycine/betaine ABC transporter n=1 Tax=Alkalihalobacillus trypoxylicola TaxID=519424 RepID=A0A162F421_9BACI|nr:BCCT family transporter [Alkalihalobacillus trypoxylicola]KYG34761.1 glycine/betaine ABC transporter [Alkalihalobacillus trypoxylicola]
MGKKKRELHFRSQFVLYASVIGVVLFVLWGMISPTHLGNTANTMLSWIIEHFGWFYMLVASSFVLFGFIVALSPVGKLRLGKDDDKPEHSFISWVGMLFAAGLGVGFVFFGVAEPIIYYLDTPPGVTPGTVEAAEIGLQYGVFHWGFHAWGAFSVVGLTLAYVQYRKNRPALISSAFYPLIGNRVNGWLGKGIDLLAVISTCAGVATTFGLSALQISGGVSFLTPLSNNIVLQLSIIAIITVLFLFSAVVGIEKGIKRLTNINLVLAGLLLIFVFFAGPTITLLESMVSTFGGYLANIIDMSLTMTPFSESEWLGANTIFFWAWHMSWSPFVGLFIARISKGRTIREFMAGVLLVPTLLAVIWFTVFGGTALEIEMSGIFGLAEVATNEVELTLFYMLEYLPLTVISSILAIIVVAIFFVTSADSAAFVLGSMTSGGKLNPSFLLKIIWGVLIAGTASVLLVSDDGGLEALQTAAISAALPFAFILVIMVIAVTIMMIRDFDLSKKVTRKKQQEELKAILKKEAYNELRDELSDEWREEIRKELMSIGRSNAEMIHFQTSSNSEIVGKNLASAGFPPHVNVSAIERNGEMISPSGSTEILAGDYLYVLVQMEQKDKLLDILKKTK